MVPSLYLFTAHKVEDVSYIRHHASGPGGPHKILSGECTREYRYKYISDETNVILDMSQAIYSCFASLACFANARLLVSFSRACVYARTTLDGASPMAALTSAWDQ